MAALFVLDHWDLDAYDVGAATPVPTLRGLTYRPWIDDALAPYEVTQVPVGDVVTGRTRKGRAPLLAGV